MPRPTSAEPTSGHSDRKPSVPEFTDGTVVLRALRDDDAPALVTFAQDERSRRFVALPDPCGEQHAHQFIDASRRNWSAALTAELPQRLRWAIEVDGRLAGSVNVRIETGGRAEIGFGIQPEHRGRGIGSRAVRLLVNHLFDDRDIEVVAWRASFDNLASWRVAWSVGFHLDGVRRGMHLSTSDHRTDERLATLLRDEPRHPRHPWFVATELEGDRVRLRPWHPGDAPVTGPDEASERYNEGGQPQPEEFGSRRAEQLRRMSAGEGVFWCIADADNDHALGSIQLGKMDHEYSRGSASLGFWLFEHARGRGVIQEALEVLIPHAFAPRTDEAGRSGLGLHRIVARADADNRASQRALRRAGFREGGRERAHLSHGTADHPGRPPSDVYAFDLLKTDDRVSQTVEPAATQVLTTARLRLRPWRAEDVPRPEHELDRDSLRFMPLGAQPTAGTFEEWFARRARQSDLGANHWCIARRQDDEPLGMISVWSSDGDLSTRSREIGYWLYEAFRGHGYMREAIEPVLDHAFAAVDDGGLALNRLHAGTDAENTASHVLLSSMGFTEWGHDHEAFVRPDGSFSDGRYFEKLAKQHLAD